jgi:hypothetical protein
MQRHIAFAAVLLSLMFSACSSSTVLYRYDPSKGGRVVNGLAEVDDDAPDEVKAAIAAGNRIAGLPYRYGGGRCEGIDEGGYDCSGAASYVLREAGLLGDWMTSSGFQKYGRSGRGDWITVYARSGHVFLEVAGLRFDTGWHGQGEGPRWTTKSRTSKSTVLRHPSGL